jgi:hypothetical protein
MNIHDESFFVMVKWICESTVKRMPPTESFGGGRTCQIWQSTGEWGRAGLFVQFVSFFPLTCRGIGVASAEHLIGQHGYEIRTSGR